MKTFVLKAKDIKHEWFVADAEGQGTGGTESEQNKRLQTTCYCGD